MLNLKQIKELAKNYILSFLELQFVISLMSLPLLIVWGIPISIMSPLANFIFTPLLILFLWVSCLASICIIAKIPCSFFEIILNNLTDFWIYLLSFSKPTWLIGFPIKMIYLSLIIFIAIIVWYVLIRPTQKITVVFLTSCWFFMIILHPLFVNKMKLQQVSDLPLWTLRVANKTYLIDNGALCTRKNMYTNLDYTILPKLIYHTGFTTIDTIIFNKPSTQIIKIAQQCSKQFNCKKFIVTQKGQCYQKMEEYFKNTKITVHPLVKKKKAPVSN
jgi:hypothetical protein